MCVWVRVCVYCLQLSECIDGMRHSDGGAAGAGGMSEHRQDVLIQRYQEIHFDYSTEFKNTSVTHSLTHCLLTACLLACFVSACLLCVGSSSVDDDTPC